jgi:phosphoribosylglycinamide formyltransferase-1
VHAVTAELDHGPILAQAVVPVLDQDTPSTLAARVLSLEHQLLPMSVIAVLGGLMRLSPAGWVAGSPRPGFESFEFRPWHVHPNLTRSPD